MTELRAAPEPVSYRFAWTPELYAEIVGRRPPPELGLTGTRDQLVRAVLAALALIAGLALLPVLAGLYPLDAMLIALWGALGALIAVLVVVIPHLRRARIAADLAIRRHQGEMRVRLSSDGVEMASDTARSETRWPGVALVSETPKATLLWLGAASALPVPDAALPAGLGRGELLARIAAWRGAAP